MINPYNKNTTIILLTDGNQKKVDKFLSTYLDTVGSLLIMNRSNKKISIKDNDKVSVINRGKKISVSTALNIAVRQVLSDESQEYIFIVKDDIQVDDNTVWKEFIDTAAQTGIWCGSLSFGRFYPKNPATREIVDYDKLSIEMYVADDVEFMLIHRNAFLKKGFFDEVYLSDVCVMDFRKRVYHSSLGLAQGITATIFDVGPYISLPSDRDKLVIDGGDLSIFNAKHGHKALVDNVGKSIPDQIKELAMKRLEYLETHYSKKDIVK